MEKTCNIDVVAYIGRPTSDVTACRAAQYRRSWPETLAKAPLPHALLVSCDGVNRPGMMCMTFIHCSLMPASTMVWSARLAAIPPAPL